MNPAKTPAPPYFAVIFTSMRTEVDCGYSHTDALMERLAAEQPGFLGLESARDSLGITVSYWRDEQSIAAWKGQVDHALAQERGRQEWYRYYHVRVAKVERAYGFEASTAVD